VEDKSLREDLESVSDSLKWREKPPATPGLLRRRAEEDVEQFLKILRSAGYYGAEVTVDLDEEQAPPTIVFDVRTGEVFRFESIEWTADESGSRYLRKLPKSDDLGLRKGDPARAQPILDAERRIIQALKKRGHPFAKMGDRRVVVDHQTRTVQVTFTLEPGPVAHFGPTTVTGLKNVREPAIRNRFLWKQGDRFNAELITETEKELAKSELFSLVRITPAESLDADGQLPMTLEVNERKHRSVKVGASYRTDEGPGGAFGWEHRNLFHHGEKLELNATASLISSAFDASFLKPDFFRPNQSLLLDSRLANDDTEAYISRYLEAGITLERKVGKTMKWSLGPTFRWEQVEQLGEEEEFALLGFQSLFGWDRSDNLLDPTRGGRLQLQATPYWDTLDPGLAFAKGSIGYSHYFRLRDSPRIVLAARTALGFLAGAERDAVPADLRFYAGGGGSVRGYPYQTVGPLTDSDDPLGGRSLFEVSTELRVRVTRDIEVVGFIDGGSAFESSTPDFSEEVLWGTGLGLRYHTPIGPLRLDVGVPLQRREEIDDFFQVYVSIGQAF
jgi:translocation and assembly module TamA